MPLGESNVVWAICIADSFHANQTFYLSAGGSISVQIAEHAADGAVVSSQMQFRDTMMCTDRDTRHP